MFLFLVPFVYIVFSLFGLAAKMANEDPAQLAKSVGITGVLAHAVVSTEDLSFWSHLVLLVGAAGALVITARSLVKALFIVHWLVWRIPRAKPSGMRPGLVAIGIALVLTILSIGANDVRQHVGTLGSIIAILIVTGAAFGTWWWASLRLPHAPVPATSLIPGSVLMAIGVDVLHLLTTYGIAPYVARKSNTYGAVGIALAVLLWVYVLGRIVVGSAGLNATLWHRGQESLGVSPGGG
jgi:uncharacterized BrkB/YihY/UPF0761 family membrane protein